MTLGTFVPCVCSCLLACSDLVMQPLLSHDLCRHFWHQWELVLAEMVHDEMWHATRCERCNEQNTVDPSFHRARHALSKLLQHICWLIAWVYKQNHHFFPLIDGRYSLRNLSTISIPSIVFFVFVSHHWAVYHNVLFVSSGIMSLCCHQSDTEIINSKQHTQVCCLSIVWQWPFVAKVVKSCSCCLTNISCFLKRFYTAEVYCLNCSTCSKLAFLQFL